MCDTQLARLALREVECQVVRDKWSGVLDAMAGAFSAVWPAGLLGAGSRVAGTIRLTRLVAACAATPAANTRRSEGAR